MSFDGWLDARDSATLEREWATVGAKRVELPCAQGFAIRPEGAALLAAQFLGCSPERFAWWSTERYHEPKWPPPTFQQGRPITRSFFDHDFIVADKPSCSEDWQIREVVEGSRGVQHVSVDVAWGEMTRDGGEGSSATFVRVFDRSTSRAVSIRLWSTAVWVVGEVDLGALDLFGHRQMFKLPWKTYDPDSLRGFFAQLTADLDAHFDTCAAWPGGVTTDEVIEDRDYNYRVRQRVYRYASGAYAIELAELLAPGALDGTGWLTIKVEGLPWGHSVRARIDSTDHPVWGVEGWIDLNLPRAQLDATLARLAAIPGLVRK